MCPRLPSQARKILTYKEKKRQLRAAAFIPEGLLECVSNTDANVVIVQTVDACIVEVAILDRNIPAIADWICEANNRLPCKTISSIVMVVVVRAAASACCAAAAVAMVAFMMLVLCRSKAEADANKRLYTPAGLDIIETIEHDRPCIRVASVASVAVVVAAAVMMVFFS